MYKEKQNKLKSLENIIEETSMYYPHLLFESIKGFDPNIKIIEITVRWSTVWLHLKIEELERAYSLPLTRFLDLVEVNNKEVVIRFSDRKEPISISSYTYLYELIKNEEVRGKLEQLFRDIIEKQVGGYIQEIKIWKSPIKQFEYEIKNDSWSEHTPESSDGMRRGFWSTQSGKVLTGKIQFDGEEKAREFWIANYRGPEFNEKIFINRKIEELKERAKSILEGLPVPQSFKKSHFEELELL